MRVRFTEIARHNLKSMDFIFLLITLVLVAFGLVMVFSASYYSSISVYGTPFHYLFRDLIWITIGLFLMAFGFLVDYRFFKKFAFLLMLASLAALVLVLVVGATRNGATRWLAVGPISFMPGEWAKMGIIFFMAWFFGEKPIRARRFWVGIAPALAVTAIFAFLIIQQPNLSTAITVCGIAVAMMLVAGMSWIYVFITGGVGAAAFGFIALFMKDSYWYVRMTNFIDPFKDVYGEGYQVAQSLLALGSGGVTGVGLGKSVQKSLYLPEPQNDFILAIIGEELGLIGILCLLAVYCLFIWRGMRIAINAPDRFSMLLSSGVVLMVAIQVILNVAVVTASMPATGINLPFISYGGNAIMMFMFAAGMLLNISAHESPQEEPLPGEERIV